MKRALYLLANLFGGLVLVLLLLDPARPLAPVLALLALAVARCFDLYRETPNAADTILCGFHCAESSAELPRRARKPRKFRGFSQA
jgi:hypothetical protein